MKMKMSKCKSCFRYTLQDICPHCGGEVGVIFPAKYSPEDKYGKYRRILKKQMLERE
ncbi:MAG: RNA-protein complex protein Nop10 [Euryarchaeota archaeon]|nr:RNA-protein complex protein Nop10 [Euryarchaeota archaeon]MBV1730389.1 RNA-protein complex protein Nop10 [Methanobacterium sp.]MBU4548210.1 RNA-protein complex protein Nop10 [Euryarchaeota archaeon]MBU4608743.1 RNA-protein complex protein Nop10 [Euryarchaeota archaeon]MBV1755399.1 RNA-protein complex protein Nop10 [Methanobacterium sp.]